MKPDFNTRFWEKAEAFYNREVKDNPDFKASDGTVQGFFSASNVPTTKGDGSFIYVTVSPFHRGGFVRDDYWIPKEADGEAYVEKLKAFYTQGPGKHFASPAEPLEQATFNRIVLSEVERLKTENPSVFIPLASETAEDKKISSDTLGIYKTSLSIPSKKTQDNAKIQAIFALRPISDYLKAGTNYLRPSYDFHISTRTLDHEHAQQLIEGAAPVLASHGFVEFDLLRVSNKNHTEKTIPFEWIDPERIKVRRNANARNYAILVVPDGKETPPVYLFPGTDDAALAEKMRQLIVESFLPLYAKGGEREGQPITLSGMRQFIDERYPPPPRKEQLPNRSDMRTIISEGKPLVQLLTPGFRHNTRVDGEAFHGYQLKIAPVRSKDVPEFATSYLVGNLNTSDETLALERLRVLQNLAEMALKRFFDEHPGVTVASEVSQMSPRGKPVDSLRFRSPTPGEAAPAGQIFFSDLAEQHIRPALVDFERYIYWHTDVAQGEDKKWRVTFQPMRNNGEAFAPDASMFSAPASIITKDRESARQFAHTLELGILGEQQLFGRERPVERFGDTSANVAMRESLRAALKTHAADIDLNGSNLLAQLQKGRGYD